MDTWNPIQYAKFTHEREQPFFDLLALVHPAPGMRIVDLGCGTGNLTRVLHGQLNAHETIGLDRSPRMLEAANHGTALPGLRFELGEIESFAGDRQYDLIFSNAALQWVRDHDELVHRFSGSLKPGGQLVFQVPTMHDNASHTAAEALTERAMFRAAFTDWRPPLLALAPEGYARLLHESGFIEQHVRLVIYPHVLPGREDVVEWMKGTLLTAYEKRLTPDQFAAFVDQYRELVLPQLDAGVPFFFPFRRILCWGRKGT